MSEAKRPGGSGLRRVLMNVAFITGSNLTGRVLMLVLHAALGRMFGPEGLGGFATAIAFSTYFIFLVDFGAAPRLEREGATAPEALGEMFAEALGLKVAMAIVALLGLVAIYRFLPFDTWVVELCVLFAIASIIRSFAYLTQAVCRARERLELAGIGLVLNAATFVATSLFVLQQGYPIVAIGYTSILAACVQLGSTTLFAGRFISFSMRFPPRWEIARAALPYATTSLSMLAFAQIDVLIMSFIQTSDFVGRYSAISRLLMIAGTLGALATAAILPTAARVYVNATRERFDEIINGAIRLIVAIGMGAAVGMVVIAEPVLAGIYGPDFVELRPLLQAGATYLAFKFSVSILAMSLTSVGRQGDRARSVLIGLFATVVLVLILVPLFGLPGAVASMVGSEIVLASSLVYFLRERIDWGPLTVTIACVLAATATSLVSFLAFAAPENLLDRAIASFVPALVFLGAWLATGDGVRTLRFVATFLGRKNAGETAA